MAADHDNVFPGKAGHIMGGSKYFFNWLADHYEIEGAVEVDGRLYEKMGASAPVRLITVGRRRTDAEAVAADASKQHRLPEVLPVLRTWEALWQHVEDVRVKRVAHAVVEKVKPDETAPAPAIGVQKPAKDKPTVEPITEAVDDQVIASIPDEKQAAEEEEFRLENSFQAPYVSLSTIGEPAAMVPRNLLGPSQIALERLQAHIESEGFRAVEEYVLANLGVCDFSREHLADVFSPEQVDAIATAFHNSERGRGFVLGDMTGQGKGRVLAALTIGAAQRKRPVIFMSEKANLFSDFWRDIADVCGDKVDPKSILSPFILNADADIRGQDNKRIFAPSTPADRKKVMAGGLTENGFNCMFCTYSQFNQSAAKSRKAEWLAEVAAGALLITDESHNAAGASNTARNVETAIPHTAMIQYSSATFVKGVQNIKLYRPIFPPGLCNDGLDMTLKAGGAVLQEIMASMLVEDGVLMRREHDLSQLEFRVAEDTASREKNEQIADDLSSILRHMAHFSGDVNHIAARLNKQFQRELDRLPEKMREGQRMQAHSLNFGSRLYQVLRQFMLSLSVDHVVLIATDALKNGQKPVIVLEQTFESLLKDMLAKKVDPDSGEQPELEDDMATGLQLGVQTNEITFRDLLHRMLDRIRVITTRNDYGSVTVQDASA